MYNEAFVVSSAAISIHPCYWGLHRPLGRVPPTGRLTTHPAPSPIQGSTTSTGQIHLRGNTASSGKQADGGAAGYY
jgi:hypothetical protein